jgi:hypothetical protein
MTPSVKKEMAVARMDVEKTARRETISRLQVRKLNQHRAQTRAATLYSFALPLRALRRHA